MAWRFFGRAFADPTAPRAVGVCDRCGSWVQHYTLVYQYDYRGEDLANTGILVCQRCLDLPQEQLRPLKLPPDPLPIMDARVEFFSVDENDYLVFSNGNQFVTSSGDIMVISTDTN